ncbi:PREDICTED: chymotrypsin-2-like [Ceratosolen solmsi marchali]|uniref:Chymotrypsin-2-like n=1 Tax=Ceratosolen solmsi marchali TaxID=326594 RepID=A0AAJ7DV79_9HYME|nr:PREDICTED: chymotrypsin-2-like [Ceratosolen solmsi marchali]
MMYFHNIIYLCLLLCTGGLCKKERIVGGLETSITSYPHVVSIRNYTTNSFICAGSIISQWNILTAAHCLFLLQNYNDVRIYSGTSSSSSINAIHHGVDYVVFHPDFAFNPEQNLFLHNIAIIKVRSRIFLSVTQAIIALPTAVPFSETVSYIVGWGEVDTADSAIIKPILTMSTAIFINSQDCGTYYQILVYDSQICTVSLPGVGVYAGDAGGSVTRRGELQGIISYTFNRLPRMPTIHTKVFYYLNFIRHHMIV